LQHLGIGSGGGQAGFVGMNSDAGVDAGIVGLAVVLFGQADSAVGGVGSFAVSDC